MIGSTFSHWLAKRSSRDQVILKIGAWIVLAMLVYALIILPLNKAIELAQTKWESEHTLLEWTKPRLAFLKEQLEKQPTAPAQDALLPLVETELNRSELKPHLISITTSPEGVRVQLKDVSFDQVLIWLGKQKEQKGLEVHALSATTISNTVKVDVEFTIGNP